MRVYALDRDSETALAGSLDRFERRFSYPLGAGRRFRIEHLPDYTRFYRSLGEARCYVAEERGEVAGALAIAIRRIVGPGAIEHDIAYLGDLKISPEARGGRVLLRLADAAAPWIRERTGTAYGVVMDGTSATPDLYTGRARLPAFCAVAKATVVRLPTRNAPPEPAPAIIEAEPGQVAACFRKLSAGRYSTCSGNAGDRSLVKPLWLMHAGGTACGCLEDTRRAKRLILEDGTEMLSAHLSSFACGDPRHGATLVNEALRRAGALGFPALFVAIAAPDSAALLSCLGAPDPELAPATIFAHGVPPGNAWNINSSEI